MTNSQPSSLGGLATPTQSEELLPGLLPDCVLADSTLVFHPDSHLQALYLEAAATTSGAANWQSIDAAVASLSGQTQSQHSIFDRDQALIDYSTLPGLDQLTGLFVTDDDPLRLPASLRESNTAPLLDVAIKADQLLVYKNWNSNGPLTGIEALMLGSEDDCIVLQQGQNNNLWIDTAGGRDRATVLSNNAPLFGQWRGLEQLYWQPTDADGAPIGPASGLGDEHHYAVKEDEVFNLAAADLFPFPGQLVSLQAKPINGPDSSWLKLVEAPVDGALPNRLVIETLVRDKSGRLLSDSAFNALQAGSEVQVDVVVSDNRANTTGLLAMELDLNWNSTALVLGDLRDVKLAESLPLFRNPGVLDTAAGTLKGLVAASLPNAGVGTALGDSRGELFASIRFTMGTIKAGEAAGLPLTVSPVKLAARGGLAVSDSQVVVSTSDSDTIPVIQGLALQPQVGQQSLELEGLYADGRSWKQQLSLTVLNSEDAPQALPAPALSALEDQELKLDLSAYFSDEDVAVGDQLTFRLRGVTPTWLGLDSKSGQLGGTPKNEQVGEWDLDVEATDRNGRTARQTIKLTIDNVNDAPTWSGTKLPPTYLRENKDFKITLPGELFRDEDQGDQLSYSYVIKEDHTPDLASWLQINPSTGGLFGTAPDDSPSSYTIELIATDREGASSSTSLELQVVDKLFNRPPYLVGEPLQDMVIREGESVTFELPSFFRDDDSLIGDSLRFRVDAPSWMTFDATTGILRGLSNNDTVGRNQISVYATDDFGTEAVAKFQLTVANVNNTPEVLSSALKNQVLLTGSRFQLDLKDVFKDIDKQHGDALSYGLRCNSTSTLGIPNWLKWDSAKGQLELNPGAEDRGLLSLQFQATDRAGAFTTYQLDLGIASNDGLVQVNEALEDLVVQPGQTKVLDFVDAFLALRDSGEIEYSVEVLRRGTGESLTPLTSTDSDWVTLVDRRTEVVTHEGHLTIEPVLHLLNGDLISATDLGNLKAGTGIKLAIRVEDLRQSVDPGLIGLDLDLNWKGLELVTKTTDLKAAISELLPLFRNVDTSKLAQQRLGISAASLPGLKIGSALGDAPNETFLELEFVLRDPSQPVRIDLELRDQTQGGLGIGLEDGSKVDLSVLNLVDFSNRALPSLKIAPTTEQLGQYALRLIAKTAGFSATNDSVSQIVGLKIGDASLQGVGQSKGPGSLPIPDNVTQRLQLDQFFSNPDHLNLTYSLSFASTSPEDEELLRQSASISYDNALATLDFTIPGLNRIIRGTVTITASDGLNQTTHGIAVVLTPRSEVVNITSQPNGQPMVVKPTDLVGLATLFKASNLVFNDQSDATNVLLRSVQPLTVQLSEVFCQQFGVCSDTSKALQSMWSVSLDNGYYLLSIPVSDLAQLGGVSSRSPNFNLDWLVVVPPQIGGTGIQVDMATQSYVQNDSGGQLFGLSRSNWNSSILASAANPGFQNLATDASGDSSGDSKGGPKTGAPPRPGGPVRSSDQPDQPAANKREGTTNPETNPVPKGDSGSGDQQDKATKRSSSQKQDQDSDGAPNDLAGSMVNRRPEPSQSKNEKGMLQGLIDQLLAQIKDESTLVGMLMGVLLVPNGVERSVKSVLVDSGLGRGIKAVRRNPNLEAHWPLNLNLANGNPLGMRLSQGRLYLVTLDQSPNQADGIVAPAVFGNPNGCVLWSLLEQLSQPGEMVQQIDHRLEQLLGSASEDFQLNWLDWLDAIRGQLKPDALGGTAEKLDGLRHAVATAREVDPGMADALMTMELLDCHVRLGGQVTPWLVKEQNLVPN
jgi:hypothetical protein